MNFSIIKQLQKDLDDEKQLMESVFGMKDMLNEDGQVLNESVQKFIDDAREFVKHGNFPLWKAKTDKEDENNDGTIDDLDGLYYFSKVIAGLVYYMKRNLKSDVDSFDSIVSGLTTVVGVDVNVKTQAEKHESLSRYVDKVADGFNTPEMKAKLSNHIDKIEQYYLA